MAPVVPIEWNSDEEAYNTIGTNDWGDYDVGVDVMLEAPGTVEVLGRFNGRDYGKIAQLSAYLFSVQDTGAWSIVKADLGGTRTTLASGTMTALGTMTWHHVDLSLKGSSLTASVDGKMAGQATDTTFIVGPAGLGVGLVSASWLNAQFDNLTITPLGPLSTAYTDTIVNRASGLALDVAGQSTAEGALLQQSAASGGTSQLWQLAGDRSGYTVVLNANSGKAMGAPSAAGGSVDQQTPDGGAALHWTLEPAGGSFYRIVSPAGMAVAAASSGDSIALAPLDCASNAQEWSFAASPASNATYAIVNHQTGWVVDVNAQSTMTGATVIQWPANGGNNQAWLFTPAAGGGFVLRNANSGLALDVAMAGADQATPSGAASQTWTLKPAASPGYYTITSGAGGGVLASPSSTQGAQLVVAAASGGAAAAQEWMLAPVP
jgi:hypothetical protein